MKYLKYSLAIIRLETLIRILLSGQPILVLVHVFACSLSALKPLTIQDYAKAQFTWGIKKCIMLHHSHIACMSCSHVAPNHSCITVSHLMSIIERTRYHSTMTLKHIQRSNNLMGVSQINAWRYLCLHKFLSA